MSGSSLTFGLAGPSPTDNATRSRNLAVYAKAPELASRLKPCARYNEVFHPRAYGGILPLPVESTEPEPTLLPPVRSFSEVSGRDLAAAGAMIGVGLLLRKAPATVVPGKAFRIPTDWKMYARVILGVLAVHKINKALDWLPPAWLGAIETVAVVNPLAMGFSRKSMAQLLVMAPFMAGMVQGANWLHEKIRKPLKETLGIPASISRLLLSVALGVVSIKLYPDLFRRIGKSGLLGAAIKEEAAKAGTVMAGSAMMTCARGCTPGGLICLSEMGEIFGGVGGWAKGQKSDKSQ